MSRGWIPGGRPEAALARMIDEQRARRAAEQSSPCLAGIAPAGGNDPEGDGDGKMFRGLVVDGLGVDETEEQSAARAAGWHRNDNPDYLHHDKEHTVTITPGELRGRVQPTILLRMTSQVAAAPGNTDTAGLVFHAGLVVFAQYVGNGRLLLTPIMRGTGWAPHVVMASALNTTAEIVPESELMSWGRPAAKDKAKVS